MNNSIRILWQTTIPAAEDDWSIERFSLVRDHLASIKDQDGNPIYEVTARNRESNTDGNDALLSRLGESDFDERREV